MRRVVDLALRKAGSIRVALIYDRAAGNLAVFVHDAATGEELLLPVSGDEAAEVYRHPFAYAHRATNLLGARRARAAEARHVPDA